jgi:hypothetical protein
MLDCNRAHGLTACALSPYSLVLKVEATHSFSETLHHILLKVATWKRVKWVAHVAHVGRLGIEEFSLFGYASTAVKSRNHRCPNLKPYIG